MLQNVGHDDVPQIIIPLSLSLEADGHAVSPLPTNSLNHWRK